MLCKLGLREEIADMPLSSRTLELSRRTPDRTQQRSESA